MIDPKALLADLTRQLKRLEDDLRRRIADVAELQAALRAEWNEAHEAGRTADTFETWAEQVLTQAAVHWLLSCVFLRFVEDNALVERPWLGGRPDTGALALARDRHEAYFRAHPTESDRDYLQAAFREAGALPGLHTFFDEAHNPVFRLGISGDAAMALLQFWQQVDPNDGKLVHDFTNPDLDTRFLGDLYQDLSEATRKRYALLQTPEFVEEFILDRTLTPAIQEFGFREVRLIDPTCGSGHFLLGAFHRLADEWARHEPGLNRREVAKRALLAVAGVDLNPFAVAIARFRLLVEALRYADVQRLRDAPEEFEPHIAIGDSLLHGTRFSATETQSLFDSAETHADTGIAHAYATEDLADVRRILAQQYHVVVGNPPYITVKDAALNAAYRSKYVSCHRQYSLGCPFTERFFELAVTGGRGRRAGFVGLITANSFMKREFGSKLIELVLPRLDLTHVLDTSGAYIPGHGTPTVILLGRHQPPVDKTVRMVMGIEAEPSTPEIPAQGLAWSAIVKQIDQVGSESAFVSVADVPRGVLSKHPWSMGGGGAADLKEQIQSSTAKQFASEISEIGFFQDTHADDVFVQPSSFFERIDGTSLTRPCIRGDGVRDWGVSVNEGIFFPYNQNIEQWTNIDYLPPLRWLWRYRTTLWSRSVFGGQTYKEVGRPWWDYHQFPRDRARAEYLIGYSEIATHNHFVIGCRGNVFNRTAPVIKIPAEGSKEQHLALIGVLNSSIGGFWLKQVCQDKAGGGIGRGIQNEAWEARYAFNASNVAEFPLSAERPTDLATRLDALASQLAALQPAALRTAGAALPTHASLNAARAEAARLRRLMVAAQEELDWRCYGLYGLLPPGVAAEDVEHSEAVEVALGERAFEIVLARRVAAGQEQTSWFERHGSTPVTEIPAHWPEAYRRVVQRRIELIGRDRNLGLIERPEYKRRWNARPWAELEREALREWLLAHLELPQYRQPGPDGQPQLGSTRRLADAAQADAGFMQVAALYAGHADFNVHRLVAELVAAESVPCLPVLRYSESGLRKRAQWEATWALQRREDAIDAEVEAEAPGWREELQAEAVRRFGSAGHPEAPAWVEQRLAEELARQKAERKENEVGRIPVPPKYRKEDFLSTDFWRLRGALDVPKERWISYPGAERGADGSLPIAWAGWDHLQQTRALAAYCLDMKDNEGWPRERLQPLLAGLLELVPWLRQWHNQMDPEYGQRMGDAFDAFVRDEARELGFTLEDLQGWRPAVVAKKRGRKAKA